LRGEMMKKISSVICLSFIVILLFVTSVLGSSDWMKYEVDNEGNVHFYKEGSIDKEGGNYIVQVWDKWVYSDKGREIYIQLLRKRGRSSEEYDKMSYDIVLREIDCKKNRNRTMDTFIYDMDNKLIDSSSNKKLEWNYMVPNSIGDSFRKKVCP
jgi:hypothetical protein